MDTEYSFLQTSGSRDRRASLRFPLQLELCFQMKRKCAPLIRGRTVNISSSGLLFVADVEPVPRSRVCLWVEWPVVLDQKVALRLIVHGWVNRVSGGRVAVALQRFEFRTAAKKPLFVT
jgi:hypothetical protein